MFIHFDGSVTPASDIAVELYEELLKCYAEIADKEKIIVELHNKVMNSVPNQHYLSESKMIEINSPSYADIKYK